MHSIDIKSGGHKWEKQNLMTLKDSKGHYDFMICSECKIEGKRRAITSIDIDGRIALDRVIKCINYVPEPVPTRIRVTNCGAFGPQFANLTPNTECDVVEPPKGYANDENGVWVMGVSEAVKLLASEYTKVH